MSLREVGVVLEDDTPNLESDEERAGLKEG